MTEERFQQLKRLDQEAAGGPWEWYGNAKFNDLYLATPHGGRLIVMNFRRWGMSGAAPCFQVDGRMKPVKKLVQFEVGNPDIVGMDNIDNTVYRHDIRGIAHSDATFIAECRQGFTELIAEVEALNKELDGGTTIRH